MKYVQFKELYYKRYSTKVEFSKYQNLLFNIQKKLDEIYTSAMIISDDFNKYNIIYENFIKIIENEDLNNDKVFEAIKKINIKIQLKYIVITEKTAKFYLVK